MGWRRELYQQRMAAYRHLQTVIYLTGPSRDENIEALNLFPKITELDGVYRLLGIDICNDS
jgi:hypothetical protein